MKYGIIKNERCVNVIMASADFAASIGAVEVPAGFGIDDFFDGQTWSKSEPEPVVDVQADTDAMLVDHEFRLTLLELGVI